MKHLLSSLFVKVGLSIRLFTVACSMIVIVLIVGSSKLQAAPTVTITPVNSNTCGGSTECCLAFTVYVPAGETLKGFYFTLTGTGGGGHLPDDCWNFDCAIANAYVSSGSFTPIIADGQTISFSFSGGGLDGPATFSFILCPRATCYIDFMTLTWGDEWENSHTPPIFTDGQSNLTIPGCSTETPACPSCDQVDLYSHECFEQVCFTRHWPAPGGSTGASWNLNFIPPLPNYPCAPSGSCSLTAPQADAFSPGWTMVQAPPFDGSNWTVTGPTNLDGCQTVCFDIPKCSGSTTSRTVTVTNTSGDAGCVQSRTGTFKIGVDPLMGSVNSIQNFPNPLTEKYQFKTTIPFQTSSDGEAKIMIFDETGKKIFSDIQYFDGAGSHFFYFTGEQLAAGKYFYTIESPIGVMIVKQTLLIVK